MDAITNGDPNEIDYAKVPITELRQTSCKILSRSLNPTKVLLSEEGIYRDWRGIAHMAGLYSLNAPFVSTEKDPMAKVLSLWLQEGHNDTANFDNLLKFLGKIDRWDVADDLTESLAEDAKAFKSKKYQEQLNIARKEASTACNDFDNDTSVNFNPDGDFITNDDIENARKGLPLEKYDAFVLFADEDYDFACQLVECLEKDDPKFGFKICVQERNLLAGIAIRHEAIMRLISQRCDRLIVIVSAAFFKSAANTFFTNYAAALQIEQKRRKIIPCLYEPCELPPTLNFYFYLKYYQTGRFFNFWEKLSESIRSPPCYYLPSQLHALPGNALPSIQIEEVNDTTIEPQAQKVETPPTDSAPVKMPRKQKTSKVPEPITNNVEQESSRLMHVATSMNNLDLTNENEIRASDIAIDMTSDDSFDVYKPQLSSSAKSNRSKTKWLKNLFPSINSGSKTNLSSISSGSKTTLPSAMSFESVAKPKLKKNWLKRRLTSSAT